MNDLLLQLALPLQIADFMIFITSLHVMVLLHTYIVLQQNETIYNVTSLNSSNNPPNPRTHHTEPIQV